MVLQVTLVMVDGSRKHVALDSREIPDRAFFECSKIESVVIPDGVTRIGNCAFSRCSSLAWVVIPDGVTSIGSFAFRECSNLGSLVIIPDSIEYIGTSAFWGCRSLKSVVIPKNVSCIDSYAFYGCSSIQSIVIPDGVTSVGMLAFCRCSSLEYVWCSAQVHKVHFPKAINMRKLFPALVLLCFQRLRNLEEEAGDPSRVHPSLPPELQLMVLKFIGMI